MKLLLVDDHSLFRQGMELILKQIDGIEEIIHAESGNQAIENLKSHPELDLVLLDYNLGDGIGVDVLNRIKTRDPSIPVAMISGESNPRIVQQCLDHGANGYILKNMDSTELKLAVEKLLSGQYYIPSSILNQSSDKEDSNDKSAHLNQLAEIARSIIQDNNLGLRAPHPDDKPCELVSAFNSMLEELDERHNYLSKLAFKDELTGLANRRSFLQHLEQNIKLARRSKTDFALIYIDLDKFKNINDTLGHDMGDELLIAISRRLEASVREIDTVARLGGDEFTILLSEIGDMKNTEILLQRIMKNVGQNVQLGDRIIQPEISMGVTLCQGKSSPEDIIKRADAALYQVKKSGRNAYAFN